MKQNWSLGVVIVLGAIVVIGLVYFMSKPPVPTDTAVSVVEQDRAIEEDTTTATATDTSNSTTSITSTTESIEVVPEAPVSPKPVQPTVSPEPVVITPVIVDPVPPTPPPLPVASTGITMTMVATHNSASSCWTVIAGNVYDLTAYIPKHPGGRSEVLAVCGRDGTALFDGQHEGESKPERVLAGYFLDVAAI